MNVWRLSISTVFRVCYQRTVVLRERPFRAPHHTCTAITLVGGGRIPRPGEVSLAHRGGLFLDELLEFNREALEALRQPLEDGQITVSRLQTALTFPCRFSLLASMNPCPCGYYGDNLKECICTPQQIKRYRQRISGPLLDRFDLQVEVPRLTLDELQTRPQSSGRSGERVSRSPAGERLLDCGLRITRKWHGTEDLPLITRAGPFCDGKQWVLAATGHLAGSRSSRTGWTARDSRSAFMEAIQYQFWTGRIGIR